MEELKAIINRYKAIQEQLDRARRDLFQEVFTNAAYKVGDHLRRIRHNDDGSVFDDITGTVAGMGVHLYTSVPLYEEIPTVQYWVRVDSPADYNSRQQCLRYGLELGKAEDFWQGDERWSLVSRLDPCANGHVFTQWFFAIESWYDPYPRFHSRTRYERSCRICKHKEYSYEKPD